MAQSPTAVPAQPPQAQTRFSGVANSSANGPPKAKPGFALGSGQTHFQTPPAGQATAGRSGSMKRRSEGLAHASSKPFEPAGQGSGFGGLEGAAKPQASTGLGGFGGSEVWGSSAFGQTSAPSFSGFSLSKETSSVAKMGAADSTSATSSAAPAQPMLSPAFTAPPTFAGFGKPASSSSKAAPGPAPEFRFDTIGSKLASALSAPAAASQSGLFSGFATASSSGGRRESEPTSEVKLTSVVSAPAQPGAFSAFAGLSKSISDVGRAGKREFEKRGRGPGASNVETISDDEGSSADEGVSDEERISDQERISNQAKMSNKEKTDDRRSQKGEGEQVSDGRKQPASESLETQKELEENKGQVAPGEAATSAPLAQPSFSSFGTAASGGATSASSSIAKTSKPFGFSTEKEGGSEGFKPPNLFGPQTTSPSIFGFGKPSGSQPSDKPPSPFGAPSPDSSEPLSFSLSLALEKQPEKEAVPADKPNEEAPSVSAKLGKEQESSEAGESARESPTGQETEQGTKQGEEPANGTSASAEPSGSTSVGGALDTETTGQASQTAPAASPVSSPPAPLFQIPQKLETPTTPQTPQTPAAAPSSPFTSPITPQQPAATPFSSTTQPTFTVPSPVASPFSAPAGVNASSPFAFAQSQTQTQSITQPVTQPLSQPSSQPAPQEKEESMDEEDTSGGALSGFGGFGGFGLGSATPADPSKPNPFGVTSFPIPGAAPQAAFTPPSDPNALFKPASFALPGGSSPFAPSTPSGFSKPAFGTVSAFGQPSTGSAFGQANTSSAFGQANTGSAFGQSPTAFGQAASPGFGSSGFGSPGPIGAAPSSNQVIGGIVGGFGQTRTLGPAIPGQWLI
jgi:nuclear pore complex protein Nup214